LKFVSHFESLRQHAQKMSQALRYRRLFFAGIPMPARKRTPRIVDPEKGMAKAVVFHQQTEELRDYLTRGRRFSHFDDDALNESWIAAYRGLLLNRDPKLAPDYADLSAEFELRNVPLPYEQVKHMFEDDLAAVRKQLDSGAFISGEIEEKLEDLLALTLACYNKPNEEEESFTVIP
jgi:hypothetical protein